MEISENFSLYLCNCSNQSPVARITAWVYHQFSNLFWWHGNLDCDLPQEVKCIICFQGNAHTLICNHNKLRSELSYKLAQKDIDLQVLKSKNKFLETQLADSNQIKIKLINNNSKLEDNCSSLETQIKTLQEQLNNCEIQKFQLGDEIKSLQEQFNNSQTQNVHLDSKILSIKKEHSDLLELYNKEKQTVSSFLTENKKLNDKCTELETSHLEEIAEFKTLQHLHLTEISKLSDSFSCLKSEHKSLENDYCEILKQNGELQNTVDENVKLLKELQEKYECVICQERGMMQIFQCGHWACTTCSVYLTSCHICRQVILNRIQIFD